MPELIFIFVVALLLFGPRKMPDIGKSIGRAMREFRRASNEFKRTIEDEVAADDIRDVERGLSDLRKTVRDPLGVSDLKQSLQDTVNSTSDASNEATPERDSK
jgi:TatA/E family protein of Tat protein translocase